MISQSCQIEANRVPELAESLGRDLLDADDERGMLFGSGQGTEVNLDDEKENPAKNLGGYQ